MGIQFVCGHCKELIRESNSTFAFQGWQEHEKCGYETYFDKFVVRETEKNRQPEPMRVRKELIADFENHKTDEAADAQKAVEEHLNPPVEPSK